MMDHKAFLSSLTVEDRAHLTTLSNRHAVVRLTAYLSLIVVLVLGIALRVPFWPVLLLPLGILQVFLFTLLHETSHDTVFISKRANRVVGTICGAIILIPAQWFRYFHFAHHRFTHDPENDPELASPKPATWGGYLWHLTGVMVWVNALKTLFVNAAGRNSDPFVPYRKRTLMQIESRLMLALYLGLAVASVGFGSTAALTYWLIPMALGQPVLRLYLLAEHGDCPHEADMFANTRTTFTTRVVRFIAWNMPYHAEHHAYPGVPFHRLPELHQRTKDHLKVTSNGYRDFHKSYQTGLG